MTDDQIFERGHAEGAEQTVAGAAVAAEVDAVFEQFGEPHPPVAIIVASREEFILAEDAARELTSRGIEHRLHELSPTRSMERLDKFLETAGLRGIRVIIATAGTVPWLPSMIATRTELPVIGVPMISNAVGGLDTLLATAQAPAGMPVACMGLGAIRNAAIYAARILGASSLGRNQG
ncbi:MAG: 5-(carboxyamino)imidazole ribonucleotide mutase [Thermoleophilia bacterium]|nr:5-(carboxyamino)imidazole ribonucleotide mutase [Thermoleophilia bacterium]